MNEIVITLPIPDRAVSPNAQRGQSKWAAIKKSKIVKEHRYRACIFTRLSVNDAGLQGVQFSGYSLAFFFKTAAFRDSDNAEGSTKAYRDGICDALGMDDRRFDKVKLSTFAKDAKNPRVEITLYQNKP